MVPEGGLDRSSGRDPPLLIEFESHSRDSKVSIRIQVPIHYYKKSCHFREQEIYFSDGARGGT